MNRLVPLAALALVLSAVPSEAGDGTSCSAPPFAKGIASRRSVTSHEPVLLACTGSAAQRIAIRRSVVGGTPFLLLVEPVRLATSLEPEACWTCTPMTKQQVSQTPFGAAVARAAAAKGFPPRAPHFNAGLTRGQASGVFLTADLCPSRRRLDRTILTEMAGRWPGASVALAVSGAWLRRHAVDLEWLKDRVRKGDLAITWVNHSDHHRYVPGVAEDRNFMMLPRTNPDAEILGAERTMIEHGVVPSVFFRFPGLASSPDLVSKVARLDLVVLGADAWLALGGRPLQGSVVLVHVNGNEENGLRILERLIQRPEFGPLQALQDLP
jgi:hypothetical protein